MRKEISMTIIQFQLRKLYSALIEGANWFQLEPKASRFATLFDSLGQRPTKNLTGSPSSSDETDNSNSNSSSDSSFNLSHKNQPILKEQTFHKGKQQRAYDLNINDIIIGKETRTTVMMKNIPNKFSTRNIIQILNKKFKGTFDLVYLPIDNKLKKNYGYAFINFFSCLTVAEFYSEFNGEKWLGTNSQKICEVTFSKLQGREKMLKHYPIKAMYAADASILHHRGLQLQLQTGLCM